MLIKNQKLMLLKTFKREGVKKNSDEHYLFYVGNFLDDEGAVLPIKFSQDVVDNKALWPKLLAGVKLPVEIDLALYPSAFKLSGTVAKVTL
jgi:hypothetical protein